LGIDGDDAIDLISKFGQEFNVDMETFDFNRYFGSEGCNPFLILFPSWWQSKFKPITIVDLVRAATLGVWIEGKK
jgi:hypothetical protein